MKYKILGYAFLVIVLAAIIWLTLLWQNKHVALAPTIQHEQNNFQTFTDPAGQFAVTYPKSDILIKPDDEGGMGTYFSSHVKPDVEIHVPSTVFPNTNFGESYVIIGSDPSIKNSADCKKFDNGAAQLSKTDKTEDINGIRFDKAEFNGAGAGNFYETRLYRVFHAGTCFEISLTLHTSNIANYPPGTVTQVNKGQAWSKLEDILNSFRFTGASQSNQGNQSNNTQNTNSGNPQCGGIAGKVCITGNTCVPDGSYPDAGGTCVKLGNGVLKGHVDVGPLCPGPVSYDLLENRCFNTADYSQTQIIVATVGSKNVIQSANVDNSGDYSLSLAPGDYTVSYKSNYGINPTTSTGKQVTIKSGQLSTVNFTIDTGIR